MGGGGGGNELLFDGADISASATSINGGGGTGNVISGAFIDAANSSIFSNWQIIDVTNDSATPLDASLLNNDTVTGVQFTGSDATTAAVLNLASAVTVLVQGDGIEDAGLGITHLSGSGSLAVTFDNTAAAGNATDTTVLAILEGVGDTTVSIASNSANGGGLVNALGELVEVDNHLTSVTITGGEAFAIGGEGATITDGVQTDLGLESGPVLTANVASSLTSIVASSTTGGVDIAAGDTFVVSGPDAGLFLSGNATAAGDFGITYTGLTIDGGSGTDSIYNGATNGDIVDLNGKGDLDAVGASGASITVGTGAGDVAVVGEDFVGGTFSLSVPHFSPNATPETTGEFVGDSVTFGAGATADLVVGLGAGNNGQNIGGLAVNGVVETTVHGAATGLQVDFSSLIGTASLVDNFTPTTQVNLGQVETAAAADMGANTGVIAFSFAGNEYLISHLVADGGAVGIGDQVVELVGVHNHLVALAAGVVHLG